MVMIPQCLLLVYAFRCKILYEKGINDTFLYIVGYTFEFAMTKFDVLLCKN